VSIVYVSQSSSNAQNAPNSVSVVDPPDRLSSYIDLEELLYSRKRRGKERRKKQKN